MAVVTTTFSLQTRGDADAHDVTETVARAVAGSRLRAGVATVFCPGSTSALTTIEFEPGAVSDLRRLFDEIIPRDREYRHNERWHDGNGHSHVRAALLGPSLAIPFADGRLLLGTWQQVVYLDFDVRPRRREIIVQVMGE